jgi:hypothetical protein
MVLCGHLWYKANPTAGVPQHESVKSTDKSLARPTSRYILFDGENISFDASLLIYIWIVLIFLQFWL